MSMCRLCVGVSVKQSTLLTIYVNENMKKLSMALDFITNHTYYSNKSGKTESLSESE